MCREQVEKITLSNHCFNGSDLPSNGLEIIKVKIYLLKALLNFKFILRKVRNQSPFRVEEGGK